MVCLGFFYVSRNSRSYDVIKWWLKCMHVNVRVYARFGNKKLIRDSIKNGNLQCLSKYCSWAILFVELFLASFVAEHVEQNSLFVLSQLSCYCEPSYWTNSHFVFALQHISSHFDPFNTEIVKISLALATSENF